MSEKSLVNINADLGTAGEFAKPIDTFIKKISNGLGTLYEPLGTVLNAKANAKAAIIAAETDAKLKEISIRTAERMRKEEIRNQENMESIAKQAIPLIGDDAKPEEMDDDWVANFFDKTRIFSDVEMQSLWAKILAGEANKSGSFSRKTINIISDFEKSDAILFQNLLKYSIKIVKIVQIVTDSSDAIYQLNGINYESLIHLENIGLISHNKVGEFEMTFNTSPPGSPLFFGYGERMILLSQQKASTLKVPVGSVLLTQAGQQLAQVCGKEFIEAFPDHLSAWWNSKGLTAQVVGS